MGVLRNRYGGDIPEPATSLVTHWDDDPWSLGAYSYAPRTCSHHTDVTVAATAACTPWLAFVVAAH